MGLRGPAPQPTRIKLVNGNPGRRPLNANEPQPDPTAPECPDWLDDVAKSQWAKLAPELVRLGLLTSLDGDAFAAYCQAYAELQLATETLRAEGRTLATDKGNIVAHPAIVQQKAALGTLKTYSALFGLDPSSRSRLTAGGQAEEKDPFEEFLKSKKAN